MKVIFTDNTKGVLSEEEAKNLYLQNRFTLQAWKDLKREMDRLAVISFVDPIFGWLEEGPFIHIEYVKQQIKSHQS